MRARIADNWTFQAEGRDFLFLAGDNAIFEIDGRIKGLMERCARAGELDTGDLESLAGGGEEKELVRELFERRVLVPVDRETPSGVVQGRVPLKSLVLHVTDACNLGCLYCYHGSGPGRGRRAMTWEVARRAVDFLMEHSEGVEEVVLVFFGGEPLLNFDLMARVADYCERKAADRDKRVRFALTTNGTLLSEKVARFLCERPVTVTVSMDGYPEVHDRNRRFADGRPSYAAIEPGVKRLLGNSNGRPVVARVTLAGELPDVPRVLDHLLSLGFAEAGLAPVTTNDADHRLGEDAMDRLLEAFGELSRRFVEGALKGGFYGFTNLVDLLVVLHEGEVRNYPCGAGLGLLSVAPDGRLYLCQRLTGEESWCMGSVFGGPDLERLDAFRREAEIGCKEPCTTCLARATCAGGCYHEALVRRGCLTAPNTHYCQWIRGWLKTGLQVYGRLAASCPEYLDKLSLLRGHEPLGKQKSREAGRLGGREAGKLGSIFML